MKDRNNLKYKILNQQWLIFLLVILLIPVLTTLKDPRFLVFDNTMNIFGQITVLDLAAAGATILIIPGNFDMSVGAVIGLGPCLMAMTMGAGTPIPAVATAGILVAMFRMFFNGVFMILPEVPSFIILLATTNVCTGAVLYLIKGVIQAVYEKFDIMNWFRLFGAVPLISIISLVGCVVVDTILRYTQIGRRIFAIDSSEKAAFLSGIRVTKNKPIFFVMNGPSVGLAVVLLLSGVGSALPSIGTGYKPQAMDAVVVGGAPISGGKGNTAGTLFDALLMGLTSSVPDMLGVNSYLQETVSGALTIILPGINAIRVHMLTKN